MKILTPVICIITLFLMQSALNAEGLYKWKDARGNTQYGDRPPANIKSESVNLPKITVIEKYADQWKPMKFDNANPVNNEPSPQISTSNSYSSLAFLAPKAGQAIRANDGDVSAMISLKPALKKGHNIVFSIDGKQAAKGKSRTNNFTGLSRGNHTVAVKVIDANGNTLKSSSVSFNVLRVSKLSQNTDATTNDTTNQLTQATRARQIPSYNSVRNQQISGQ